jgi:hypothetical protein
MDGFPGFYTGDCEIHVDVEEVLTSFGLSHTAENEAWLDVKIRRVMAETYPQTDVVTEEHVQRDPRRN